MKLLFVKLKHIGDALILTPTLAAVRAQFPTAKIVVVVRYGSEEILSGCPAIDKIFTAAAPEKSKRKSFDWLNDLKLLGELRREQFDYAFELTNGDRGRLLAGLSGAKFRCASDSVYRVPIFWRLWFNKLSKHDWRNEHQVESNFNLVNEFLPLGISEPPPLFFERSAITSSALEKDLADFIVIHPGTRWKRKRWPLENWIFCGRELLKTFSQIVISVGPDAEEVELGNALASALGARAVCTDGKLSWSQLAGLLYRAKLFVGLDTAAMHLAAACQCPIVALFASSVATQWQPWRVRHELVGATLQPGQRSRGDEMLQIEPQEVLDACRKLLGEKIRV